MQSRCVLHGMYARMHTWHKIVSDNMKHESYAMGFDMSNECIKDYLVFFCTWELRLAAAGWLGGFGNPPLPPLGWLAGWRAPGKRSKYVVHHCTASSHA